MTRRNAAAAVVGVVVGGVLGLALSYLVGFTAIVFVPYQDYIPDYAFIPFPVGLVLGPVLAVRRRGRGSGDA